MRFLRRILRLRRGRQAHRLMLRGFLLALVITIPLWTVVLRQQAQRAQEGLDLEEQRLDVLAHSVGELVLRVMQVADRALQTSAASIAAGKDPGQALRESLRGTGLDGEIIASLRLIDPSGRPRTEQLLRWEHLATARDFSDRPYFRVHAESDRVGLYVSPSYTSRRTGLTSIALTRRVDDAQGRFAGVLQVTLDANYFGQLFQRVGDDMGASLSLIGDDGIIRVRTTAATAVTFGGEIPAGHPTRTLIEAGTRDRRYRAEGVLVEGTRVLALHRLDQLPLSLVASSRIEDVVARNADDDRAAKTLLALATLMLWAGLGAIVLLVDRIERTRDTLRGALARSRSAARARATVLGSMAHELRTPLAGVLDRASQIERHGSDPQDRAMAATVCRNAARLGKLLGELHDANRIETGTLDIVLAPEPIREILADACARFAPAAEARGVNLDCVISPALVALVDCDGARMRQVLEQVLSNAVKFTDRGSIAVTARVVERDGVPAGAHGRMDHGRWLRIDVADTGTGIPADALDRLFVRFSQAHDRIAWTHGGTGLGLALSREYMLRMGGDVCLESAEGRGTAAIVILPLDRGDRQNSSR